MVLLPHRPGHGAPARRPAGFTLIELMIVVAIVGILAAVAYPAYTSSVIKGKRSEGRTGLTDLLQQQERYLTQTGSYGYNNAVFPEGATNVPFKTYSGDNPANAAYKIGARACPGTPAPGLADCVELFGVPQFSDPEANQLYVRSTGEKGCNGTKPSVCWK